jgi:hypothetical protein
MPHVSPILRDMSCSARSINQVWSKAETCFQLAPLINECDSVLWDIYCARSLT